MAVWRDVTSFSRGDEDRTPRVWELNSRGSRIRVYRHKDYNPEQWLMSSRLLGWSDKRLVNKTKEDALKEANDMVLEELKEILEELI